MSDKHNKHVSWITLIVWIALFIFFTFFIGYGLLNGTEYIAVFISITILSLIVVFRDSVQEFSIAGNTVKLKEIKSEVESKIKQLDDMQVVVFKGLLNLYSRHSGVFGDGGHIDPRIKDFELLYDEIIKFNLGARLQKELISTINVY